MKAEERIHENIKDIAGIAAVAKADTVATRAALLADAMPDTDLSSLIIGLHVGANDEMPENMSVELLGLTKGLALCYLQSMSGDEAENEPGGA